MCVFQSDRKSKMAALASDLLKHFWLPLNRWTEFNETRQEARSQRPFLSLSFFFGLSVTRWLPWSLIGWDIFDLSSETAEQNSMKLDRKQDLNVLSQNCVFGPIGKTRWLPWLLICRDIFYFSSETAERNSMKPDKRQDFNVLSLVCVL